MIKIKAQVTNEKTLYTHYSLYDDDKCLDYFSVLPRDEYVVCKLNDEYLEMFNIEAFNYYDYMGLVEKYLVEEVK